MNPSLARLVEGIHQRFPTADVHLDQDDFVIVFVGRTLVAVIQFSEEYEAKIIASAATPVKTLRSENLTEFENALLREIQRL